MPESTPEASAPAQARPTGEEFPQWSLRDIYYVLFRHKWKVILLFFAVMAATGTYTFLLPETYQSEARVLMRVGQEAVLGRSESDGLITSVRPSEQGQINTEVEILRSRDLVEEVIESIGLDAFLSPADIADAPEDTTQEARAILRAQVATAVVKSLSIETQARSNVVQVTYQARSPKLAQQVVSSLIEFYLDKHLEVHRGPGSYDFFAGQIKEVRAELAKSQKKLRNLQNETGIISVGDQRRIALDRIGGLQQEIERTAAAAFASRAKSETMRNRLAELPETLVMTETTQNRIALGKEEPTGTTVTRGLNRAYQEVQSALLAEEATFSSLKAQIEALEEQLARAKPGLEALNDNAVRFAELEQEIELHSAKYRKYSENLEQARVDRAFETERISNVSVLEPATYPVEPVPRQRIRKLAVGLLLAVFGSIGLAFLSEQMDHTLKKPEDVEAKLRLRTLASLPRLSAQAARAAMRLGPPTRPPARRLPPGAKPDKEATPESLELVASSEPGELYDYESLPERLFLLPEDSEELPRVLALTSCYSGEGVTTVASHLAVMLAGHSDGRVLLVDANPRRPSAHLVFGVEPSPGLAEVLLGSHDSEDIVQTSAVPNLDVVSAGERDASFSRKSEFNALDELLRKWRSKYRFVVLDTPAVRGGMFAGLLGSLVDGVVLVVEAERVRWEVVRRVSERLVRAKANVLGVALNKREFYIPEWLYKRL